MISCNRTGEWITVTVESKQTIKIHCSDRTIVNIHYSGRQQFNTYSMMYLKHSNSLVCFDGCFPAFGYDDDFWQLKPNGFNMGGKTVSFEGDLCSPTQKFLMPITENTRYCSQLIFETAQMWIHDEDRHVDRRRVFRFEDIYALFPKDSFELDGEYPVWTNPSEKAIGWFNKLYDSCLERPIKYNAWSWDDFWRKRIPPWAQFALENSSNPSLIKWINRKIATSKSINKRHTKRMWENLVKERKRYKTSDEVCAQFSKLNQLSTITSTIKQNEPATNEIY